MYVHEIIAISAHFANTVSCSFVVLNDNCVDFWVIWVPANGFPLTLTRQAMVNGKHYKYKLVFLHLNTIYSRRFWCVYAAVLIK